MDSIDPTNAAMTLLTFVLVVVTANYARNTAKMLDEMRRNRLLELRPFILYEFIEVGFVDRQDTRNWEIRVKITNYSSYDAIRVKADLCLKQSRDKNDEICNMCEVEEPVLKRDCDAEMLFDLPASVCDLPERWNQFGRMELWFEDRKQNLYILALSLDLYTFTTPYRFGVKSEELHQIPLEERSSLHDGSPMITRTLGRRPIYKRELY